MNSVRTLIDMASAACGSDAELCRRTEIDTGNLAAMRAGRQSVTPVTIGKLCDVLQLDAAQAREWLAIGVIEQAKDGSLRKLLQRAFFALWACGVAVSITTVSTDANALTVASTTQTSDTRESPESYTPRIGAINIVARSARPG